MQSMRYFVSIFIVLFITEQSYSQHLSAGGSHSLAVCTDSITRAWGRNSINGQLGDSTFTNSSSPVTLNSLTGILSVSAGTEFSIALKSDGTVWAWGRNQFGQLANGTFYSTGCQCRNFPEQIIGLSAIIAISAGHGHCLALKNDGTVWAWGLNSFGQLGDSTNINRSLPVQVHTLSNVIKISAGNSHSLAIKNDSSVWAWGRNDLGQIGDGTTFNRLLPVQTNILSGVTSISAGEKHSLALKSDETVWAWGNNALGAFGNGTTIGDSTPVLVNTGIKAISASSQASLFLKNDSTVWGSGYNFFGQLGNGNTIDQLFPSQTLFLNGIIAIDQGELYHSLAMKFDGSLWAWGYNQYGQLGNGLFAITGCNCETTPVQVLATCSATTVIKENESINEIYFEISPNPFSNETNLKINQNLKNATLTIYNSFGETVKQIKKISGMTFTFHRDKLASGIYFICLSQENKIIGMNKIVVTDN